MKVLLLCLLAVPVSAHVGSPDIFYQGDAGPYHLLVTIRPPQVIPGVAEIEIRCASPEAREIRILPLRLVRGRQFAPVADLAKPSREDPHFYTGSLWLMATGSWQVRIDVTGARGNGTLAVPVPAVATQVLPMQKTVGLILLPLGLLLAFGIVSIAGASAREGALHPGEVPGPADVRRGRIAMIVAAVVVGGALWFGNSWWNSEDGVYRRYVFKPLALKPSLDGSRLMLRLVDPGWLNRRTDDLVPDHDHLMHLYVIHLPEMERVWHLHPVLDSESNFIQQLPSLPAGRYALYGDIVHANGLPETATAEMDLPEIAGRPLAGDDAAGEGPPLAQADYNRIVTPLSGAFRMVWERDAAPLRATRPYQFRFRVEDSAGRPARDMELYMGMLGHAAFVRDDRSVFAHVHPSGSVPMPALALTQTAAAPAGQRMTPGIDMSGMEMPGMAMPVSSLLPAEVSFPYGFPKPGRYRIFVQVKHGGVIETGVFDAQVEPSRGK
jgi:hypothetical protein